MTRKGKTVTAAVLAATLLFAVGCNGDTPTGGEYMDEPVTPSGTAAYDGTITVSEMKHTESGKPYLEVNGTPVLMLGGQLRTDFFLQLNELPPNRLDQYFELASEMNVTVVQVPISWRDVEPTKNTYTTDLVGYYIDYCNKYNLKLEILWFGSYMCGYSVEGYIPDYVLNDPENYPSYGNNSFQGWLGKHYWLRPDNELLMEREGIALGKLMDGIWEYDRMHGGRRTVIGIQVENEPDMLATRHNAQHGYSEEEIWPSLVVLLDRMGQVVKNSKYRCYTRVNMTTDSDYYQRYEDVTSTEGIDFVGLDPYTGQVNKIASYVRELAEVEGNYPHIAENGGEFTNTDQLVLQAFKLGAGYEIFEVITTDHPYLVDWTLRGVWNPDWTKKEHTDSVIAANGIYKKGFMDIVLADSEDFLAFNLVTNGGMQELADQRSTLHCTVKWKTMSRGIAYAIERDGYLTFASTQNDTFELTGVTGKIEEGQYSLMGHWIASSSEKYRGGAFEAEGGKVYRIAVDA